MDVTKRELLDMCPVSVCQGHNFILLGFKFHIEVAPLLYSPIKGSEVKLIVFAIFQRWPLRAGCQRSMEEVICCVTFFVIDESLCPLASSLILPSELNRGSVFSNLGFGFELDLLSFSLWFGNEEIFNHQCMKSVKSKWARESLLRFKKEEDSCTY